MCGVDRPDSPAEFTEVEAAIDGMRTAMGALLLEAPKEVWDLADVVYTKTRFLHGKLVRGDIEERHRHATAQRLSEAYRGLLAACRRSLQDPECIGPQVELP